MTLFHLVYVSSAVAPFSPQALLELLERSRANNQPVGITGLLLYREGNFMQVLEGDKKDVIAVHSRISGDPRHTGLLTLLQAPIATRTFSEWSMGFRNLDSTTVGAVPGYSEFMNADWRGREMVNDPDRAMKLLKTFRLTMR